MNIALSPEIAPEPDIPCLHGVLHTLPAASGRLALHLLDTGTVTIRDGAMTIVNSMSDLNDETSTVVMQYS